MKVVYVLSAKLAVLSSLAVLGLIIQASGQKISSMPIPSPLDEKFEAIDGGLSDSGAGLQGKAVSYDNLRADSFKLYNADGTLWFEFNTYNEDHPHYLWKHPNPEFVPIRPQWTSFEIRAIGQSEHWFAGYVNESAKTIKYLRRSDRNVAFRPVEDFILKEGEIRFDSTIVNRYDAPGGRRLNDVSEPNRLTACFVREVEGDWARLSSSTQKCVGWIQWRRNGEYRIGFVLNDHKIPSKFVTGNQLPSGQ